MVRLLGSWGPWQCQLCRSAGGCHRGYGATRALSSLWQLCPSEDWAWRWRSCLGHGNPGGATCAGTLTASLQELWSYQSLFLASGSWQSEGLFGWPFSVAPPIQALKGAPWLGSYSAAPCTRWLKGQFLYLFSCPLLVCGDRGYMMAPPTTHDSAVLSCLHGCLVFLHKHFPLQSPVSCPLGLSPHSLQQTSPWIPPQSLHSSSQPLCLLGDPHCSPEYVWLWQGLSVWFSSV